MLLSFLKERFATYPAVEAAAVDGDTIRIRFKQNRKVITFEVYINDEFYASARRGERRPLGISIVHIAPTELTLKMHEVQKQRLKEGRTSDSSTPSYVTQQDFLKYYDISHDQFMNLQNLALDAFVRKARLNNLQYVHR
ncbi:MAG: hypothetical protein AAB573_00650 [Patescibacteria group bacterium]